MVKTDTGIWQCPTGPRPGTTGVAGPVADQYFRWHGWRGKRFEQSYITGYRGRIKRRNILIIGNGWIVMDKGVATIAAIASAVIGLAIVAVLVSGNAQTSSVLQAAGTAFS